MLIPYAIGIANGHEHRSLYIFNILGPIIPLQIYTDNFFHKLGEMGRIVSKAIVLLFYRCAIKHVCSSGSKAGLCIGPPPVMRIGPGQHHEPAHLAGMAYGYLKGYAAAHTIS